MRILDRYLVREFAWIFLLCILGVPFVFEIINLTDTLDTYLADGIGRGPVLMHYLYQFPYQMLLAFPIAALLATVFTVSRMTRHFEITAAKASGVSFYRLARPLLVVGLVLSAIALGLTEIVPLTERKSAEALGEERTRGQTSRLRFVYRGNEERLYKIYRLDALEGTMTNVQIEREGTGFGYPTYSVSAASARWDSAAGRWVLEDGRIRFFPDRGTTNTFRFRELHQRAFTETPDELLARPKDPSEMNYAELGRFIEALQRSGGNARELVVQRWMKISFPFAAFIIILFGAPLANSTRRGGTPFAVGVALLTTIIFLLVTRIAQALGAAGIVAPVIAAWLPNGIFLTAGAVLMTKVRT
ncbi:MAG: LptF/LptG family permease [Gemmatimonadota bacterium]